MPAFETALVHLYRGELGRVTTYRVRLDTTTNWAIGVVVAVTTFALGHKAAPPVILVLPYALTAVFAFIESRRLQELQRYRERLRILERALLAELVDGREPRPGWGEELARSLRDGQPFPLSLGAALANRVRRNYLWLVMSLYAAWWIKLILVEPNFLRGLPDGRPGPWAAIGIATALLLPWIGLAVFGRSRTDT